MTIAIGWRLLAGIGSSFIHVSCYAMAAIKWPDEVQQKIGILEASSGAGLFLGPVMGSALYEAAGYCCPFFVFVGLLLVIFPFVVCNFTPDLDGLGADGTDLRVSEAEDEGVSAWGMMKHKRVVFAALS
jgi:MFS family permease